MSIRKCKMATAILILLNLAKCGTFIDVLVTPQNCTVKSYVLYAQ